MSRADEPQTSVPPSDHEPLALPSTAQAGPGEPSSGRADKPDLAFKQPAGWPIMIGAGVISVLFGVGGAYLFTRFLTPPSKTTTVTEGDGGANSARRTDVTEARVDAPVMDTRDLAERYDQLSTQVDELKKKLEEGARPSDPPEVASLQVRVADLTDRFNQLAPLPSKVDHLDNRLSDVSNSLSSLRTDLLTNQNRGGRDLRLTSNTNAASIARPEDDEPLPHREPAVARAVSTPADNALLAKAAALFRAGKYRQANEAFSKIELDSPDDARVWYYAALGSGFATGDWTDTAVRLVEKGIAREQAGTPPSKQIDEEFKDLTSTQGKDWLAAYRKGVARGR